jgi:hypothetical protein
MFDIIISNVESNLRFLQFGDHVKNWGQELFHNKTLSLGHEAFVHELREKITRYAGSPTAAR